MFEPRTAHAIERGRVLFGARRYFKAHEVWEEAWLVETGATRFMLQGLIQIAAALLKAGRSEHPSGCLRLLDAGIEKLEGGDGDASGLALVPFVAALRGLRAPVVAWAAGTSPPPPPSSFPRLEEAPRP